MKKTNIMSFFIIILLLVIFVQYQHNNKINNEVETFETTKETFNEENAVANYDEKMNEFIKKEIFKPYPEENITDNTYYIYFGRNDCPGCQAILPEIGDIASKTDVYLYYVDTNQKKEGLEKLSQKYNIEFVPSIVKVEEDKYTVYDADKDNLETFLKK